MSLVSRASVLARTAAFATCLLSTGLLLTGCGSGDVELNGKIFDAMGVSSATQPKEREPKVAARTGLVVPPNTGSLPEPGSGRAPEAEADIALINDPDRKKTLDKAELERRQAEYCRVNYEIPKARGDASADDATGPLGPCRATFLSAMKKWSGQEGDEQDQD